MVFGDLQSQAHVTYSRQFRRCNKSDCSCCSLGAPGHGPYWYAYWREGRRLRSHYLGKQLPPAVAGPGLSLPTVTPRSPDPTNPCIRVRTLGSFEIWRGDIRVPAKSLRQRKVFGLLKCLISAPGQRVHREHAMEMLWPNADPQLGANNLRITVHRLRRILGETPGGVRYIHAEGDMLVLTAVPDVPAPQDWLDAAVFDRAVTNALAHKSIALCRAALALYKGDYLSEDLYDEWAVTRREELRQRYLAILLHTAALCEHDGAFSAAARCLHAVLDQDPYHEPATRGLMRLQVADGRTGEAVRTYRKLADVLRRELNIAPDVQTQQMYRDLLASAQLQR